MNLAVIGSGGREHAICYKLKQSKRINKLICIPGNAGTQKIAENIKEDISNFDIIYKIIKERKIDIVIVGPEQPLVDGIVDYLDKKKIRVFGPDKFASQFPSTIHHKLFHFFIIHKIFFIRLFYIPKISFPIFPFLLFHILIPFTF